MSNETYCKLIDGFCSLIGFQEPALLYERAELAINDEDCVIMHGGPRNAEAVAVFCIYGQPPEQDVDLILQRLLEANLTLMSPGGLHFAVDPVTDEVMVAGIAPMSGLCPETLLALLVELACQARDWRQHYFLGAANEHESYDCLPLSAAPKTRRLS